MPETRVYRIALVGLNVITGLLGSLQVWGPGIGINLETIGAINVIGNILIVGARQLLDPTTTTIPKGDS